MIFSSEIIRYALPKDVRPRGYYPYLVKALRHLDKGTYTRVRGRLLEKVKRKGLDPEVFEVMVGYLRKALYSDVYLVAKGFEADYRYLLYKYNVSGMLCGTYYAFANRVKRIVSMTKGEKRRKQVRACIAYFKECYYCNEDLLEAIASLVEKYYEEINKVIIRESNVNNSR